MSMTDGLNMLDEQRQRRVRSIPAPRNPPRSKPVGIIELATRSQPDSAAVEPTTPAPEPEPEVRPEKMPPAAVAAQEPTVKMSIYLEPSDDLYLEDIAHTGKKSRPRVAISRSAI